MPRRRRRKTGLEDGKRAETGPKMPTTTNNRRAYIRRCQLFRGRPDSGAMKHRRCRWGVDRGDQGGLQGAWEDRQNQPTRIAPRDPSSQRSTPRMNTIASLRATRPAFYPDQAVYAEFAARHFGLDFELHDDTGLVFTVLSKTRRFCFGGGKCPAYPQNDSTSAFLATDKYFTSVVLGAVSIPNAGGNYFFLNERFGKLRSPGHDARDALHYFRTLGSTAFVKPLTGSRGDFAQTVAS